MRRRLLLSLFLLSSFGARAMERESSSSFMALQPFWPIWLESNLLTPFQEAQERKINFEKQLQISKFSRKYWPYGLFSKYSIQVNAIEFLKYCYHQKRHHVDSWYLIDLSDLDKDVSLLNACKTVRIDGYSALGAAIIAEDTLYTFNRCMEAQYKPHFILSLFRKGFRFTEKDRQLVALHLHDVISAEQKRMMISLLHGHQEGNLALLPHDVRGCIVDYIVHLHKKSDWLCSLLNRS